MTVLSQRSHRRQNLLTGEWVLVSPHRTQRPWQGQLESVETVDRPSHDPDCYLCPGNARTGGQRNPNYPGTWAFDNDFPALSPAGDTVTGPHSLLRASEASGHCRVLCYSERHDLSLSTLPPDDLQDAVRFLFDEFARLDADPGVGHVQLFENRGAMMGCSNMHPHAQAWATSQVPDEPAKEGREQLHHWESKGSVLLLDYLAAEQAASERLVHCRDEAVALVPWWATWPFETLIVPTRHASGPADLTPLARAEFATVLQCALRACDALFGAPMPYSLGFHARPSDGQAHPEWQFHAHIYPPLLRSATVRKHMVGFELLGMPQRDLTPEMAAERLRDALNSV